MNFDFGGKKCNTALSPLHNFIGMLDNSPPGHLATKTTRQQLKTTCPKIRKTRPELGQLAISQDNSPDFYEISDRVIIFL